jgi:hypothetical protein
MTFATLARTGNNDRLPRSAGSAIDAGSADVPTERRVGETIRGGAIGVPLAHVVGKRLVVLDGGVDFVGREPI